MTWGIIIIKLLLTNRPENKKKRPFEMQIVSADAWNPLLIIWKLKPEKRLMFPVVSKVYNYAENCERWKLFFFEERAQYCQEVNLVLSKREQDNGWSGSCASPQNMQACCLPFFLCSIITEGVIHFVIRKYFIFKNFFRVLKYL